MATLNLSVVPWSSRTNQFVINFKAFTKAIKRMYALVILGICKFNAVIGLDDLRLISKVGYCTFYKINCAVTALFKIRINESFS